ncbi:class I SAM-dependent methyltransferase [Actinoplanes sp. NEAU-A12]|uniref:Class I SAM-dependent methyltransferase n=1 Tax=Actinoplanes sandaracinus TaxID=3045177 RepID=A0ABT6WPJ6_9ACTN|nr:class I SAM-dependent methyltransferase [Actinoplanes sandaracinus]MDI6101609.1 class I SAM-dependent methyltransferase [Actinoplanes sandaracinus]
MSAYLKNSLTWQESWDRQQQAFMPDREERFAAMLTAVAAVTGGEPPRLLDLAGGTGAISLRTLARFPGAQVTVLDQDPVLLTIAESSLRDRATIVDADLGDPGWRAKLPPEPFDAVLTATALHWLPVERVSALYAEVREVLRPGGVFANADRMEEEGLPELSRKLHDHAEAEREARYATGAATSWAQWWALAAADECLAPKAAERERIYPSDRHSQEWTPPASWHVETLRAAGFREAGLIWRGGMDAAVAAIR